MTLPSTPEPRNAGPFTAVPEGFMDRPDISFAAKAIFIYYLGRPDGQVPSIAELMAIEPMAAPSEIAGAYHELVNKGLFPGEQR